MNKYFKFGLIPLAFVSGCLAPAIESPRTTFIKLDQSGATLSDQSSSWNFDDSTANKASRDRWTCATDERTGLTWEIKQNNTSLQGRLHRYTWYDPGLVGKEGFGDTGTATTTQSPGTGTAGSDSCLDTARCDTDKYVTDINAQALCGFSDWRVPSWNEFGTLVTAAQLNAPNTYTNIFPNTVAAGYWTSSNSDLDDTGAQAWEIDFNTGALFSTKKGLLSRNRLVRGQANSGTLLEGNPEDHHLFSGIIRSTNN
ncbi:Uncharacterised protein [BD1-7 clade bacterium]|uniref:Lcl C-terminal domain-containing protein n=1 Tax=BD1-7 clade bacterium TaxID=2029982 RepID=A0A5S9N7N0_9GAMM|nr:Uncharacterised protein [BD1-7 clade bacterium]